MRVRYDAASSGPIAPTAYVLPESHMHHHQNREKTDIDIYIWLGEYYFDVGLEAELLKQWSGGAYLFEPLSFLPPPPHLHRLHHYLHRNLHECYFHFALSSLT